MYCRKSKANSKANFKAIFKAKISASQSGPKSFARRMKSNLMPDKSPSGGGVAAAGPTILSPVKDQAAVENVTMRQAYEDTELLKAIVVPLEEQV